MPLDPQIQPILDLIDQLGFTMSGQDPETLRAMTDSISLSQVEVSVARVEDRVVPTEGGGVPVRIYTPEAPSPDPAPALLWIHGGGWVIGSIDGSDATARRLANGAGTVVISVGYRLAPEGPFPAGFDDCVAALHWVIGNADELGIDAHRLAVGGDSAGGNLSALVALRARDEGVPLRFQLLVYPATDLTMSHESVDENGDSYLLTKESMIWFLEHYLGDHDPKDPWVSPLFADDLSGLPPALIYTAEFDPLRDEGEAYAERLRDAGVPVELERWDGQIHGFFGMHGVFDAADIAVKKVSAALRAALA